MSETRPAPETDAPPLAMQIALRVEKTAPPDELDACAAAAQACVGLLVEAERRAHPVVSSDAASGADDDGAAGGIETPAPDTAMLDAIDAWRGIAIRKIVRRCSGKRWSDAQALDGVTARHGSAEARAFTPAPTSPLPPELKKMQVEGTQLPSHPDDGTSDARDPQDVDAMVTVRLSPLVTMTSGKSAAQCAHAAQRAWESMSADERARWAADDHRVRIVRDTEAHWAATPGRVSIIDAGFTELDGQHETTRADW
ncbi:MULTISPECIES: peptidyl-tRNA hydrolase [Dermacoccus]|uniref:peptidyl-tRNA hydrolase n=1 Tax=Dermacoccus TaxID=57495 RepID=UPI001F3012CC|nr:MULTISPECIES: peptidyl-tRNA hydrolase [Dermacoccus]